MCEWYAGGPSPSDQPELGLDQHEEPPGEGDQQVRDEQAGGDGRPTHQQTGHLRQNKGQNNNFGGFMRLKF